MRYQPTGVLTGALTLVILGAVPGLQGQALSWSGTGQYARGDFIFTEPTETWSFFTGFTLQGDRARLSVGLPVLYQDSRVITWIGTLPLPTGGPDHEVVSRRRGGEQIPMDRRGSGGNGTNRSGGHGFGASVLEASPDTIQASMDAELDVADPTISGAYEVFRGRALLRSLEFSVSAKLPLNDVDSGVGTGELDYSLGVGAVAAFGSALLFVDVSWWSYGDLPDLPLEDGVSGSLALGVPLGDRLSGLASVWAASRVIEGVDPAASLSASLAYRVTERWSLNAGGSLGLTESVSDGTVWLGWRVTLLDR